MKKEYYDLDLLRGTNRYTGVLFLEELKYSKITKFSIDKLRKLFCIGSDHMFTVRNGDLIYLKTKEAMPKDEWIPLFREGNILPDGNGDLTLETSVYAIF